MVKAPFGPRAKMSRAYLGPVAVRDRIDEKPRNLGTLVFGGNPGHEDKGHAYRIISAKTTPAGFIHFITADVIKMRVGLGNVIAFIEDEEI